MAVENKVVVSESLLTSLWTYAQTDEYWQGIFVEFSGMILDVIILIFFVKLIAYYLSSQSRDTTNFASSFFIVQFLRDVLMLQLKLGGVSNVNEHLDAALKERRLNPLYSHIYYGNIENLLDLLRIRMRDGMHIDGHAKLPIERRNELAKESTLLLVRLDGLIQMLASLRQEEQCLRTYEFRLVLTALSDYLGDLSKNNDTPPPRVFAPMSTTIGITIERWFLSCKKLLDKQLNKQIRKEKFRMFCSIPRLLMYRLLIRKWKRMLGQNYRDPFGTNFPALFCNALCQRYEANWDEIVTTSGVSKKDIGLMLSQHKYIAPEKCINILLRIRQHIPADIWNRILVDTLIRDVDSRVLTVLTVDAVRASSLYFLSSLAVQDVETENVIAQGFQNLWSLRPSIN